MAVILTFGSCESPALACSLANGPGTYADQATGLGKEASWVSHYEGSFGARQRRGAGQKEPARSAYKAAFTALLT